MAATGLIERLEASPLPESEWDAAIEEALGAHVCRCTGYIRYHRAVRKVVEEKLGGKKG